MEPGFAVWITGLPASGKSTLAASLGRMLAERGIDAAVLESDQLRKVLTPHPRYDDEERSAFYGSMAYIGTLLTRHGVNVIFDATANRRAYRDRARAAIERFVEAYVECPLSVCIARDPKGIYRRGSEGTGQVPGVHVEYEPPLSPDVVVRGDRDRPEDGARRIVALLAEKGFIPR